ncbi:hypothetical protein ACFY7H_24510 [Streptomyces sp. NPDC012794]|uniref:hypothetical protein n=1 Tax=Streptomyces sp. NPDC012794 TaxID=3364850 RepID=UPI0036C0084F
MTAGDLVRPGPDGDTTDLVFRETGGSRGHAVLIALASLVRVLILFACVGVVITIFVAFFGVDFPSALIVPSLVAAAGSLIAAPFAVAGALRRVRRVRFALAQDLPRFRLIRASRPDPWMPITDLARIDLVESIVEPYEGDPLPATRTLMVALIGAGDVAELACGHPRHTDGRQLKEVLDALLSEAGVPVQLQTQRTRRPKPPPKPRRSGSAHAAVIGNTGSSGSPGSGSGIGSGGF